MISASLRASRVRAVRALPLVAAAIVCVLVQAASAAGQAIPVVNGTVLPVAASGSLSTQFRALVERQIEPAWIAYVQPLVDSSLGGCCWGSDDDRSRDGCCATCPIEPRDGNDPEDTSGATRGAAGASTIKLEGTTELILLFRAHQRRLDQVRVFSMNCRLDAGGRTVHLLTGVRPADSIALLEGLIADGPPAGRRSVPDALVGGIAMHRDPAADAAMDRLVAPAQPEDVRRRAVFWLARARGRYGFEVVRRVLREDPDPRVRKRAVFALTQSREAEVVPVLVEAARVHTQPDVRGEALFWLAQKAGRQAESAITRAIAEDPETSVKERAVFALSQLPKERSVPLLIDVAKSSSNPAVRKRAMFWLGQSKDPRAVDFFESVLK